MNIGYWGIPGTSRATMVHIQFAGQRTLCGYIMSEQYEFQWCAGLSEKATYIHRYIECDECKARLKAILKEAK